MRRGLKLLASRAFNRWSNRRKGFPDKKGIETEQTPHSKGPNQDAEKASPMRGRLKFAASHHSH